MNLKSIAYIFPGQGSQIVGMGFDLAQTYPIARKIFKDADDYLGYNLSKIAWEDNQKELNDTAITQPTLLTHSAAALAVLVDHFPQLAPSFVAGHSMGELSALISAKSLAFLDALDLARQRGLLMKRSGEQIPGGMAAILGMDITTVEAICEQASTSAEIVQVANDNCPGQVVISGAKEALTRATMMARSAGARRVIPLAVSIAAHSPLMESAQRDFKQAISKAPISDPAVPLIGNVSASPLHDKESIRKDLEDQLTRRVRWTESIQYMINNGISTFIEIGSGSVLSGLVRRIASQVQCINLEKPDDFKKLASSIGIDD